MKTVYNIMSTLDGKGAGLMDWTYDKAEAESWVKAYYEDDENARKQGVPVPYYEYHVEETQEEEDDDFDDDDNIEDSAAGWGCYSDAFK